MAKAITKTTVKFTQTHDRLTLIVKYVEGQVLRVNASRNRDSMSFKQPEGLAQPDLKGIFAYVTKMASNENHGQRFERLAKFFEGTVSMSDAMLKCKA